MKVGRQVVKYLLVVIVALGITIAATSCGFFGGNEKPIRPTNNISDNQISADKDETAIGEKDEAAVDNETEGSFDEKEENYGGITSEKGDEVVDVPTKEDSGTNTVVPSNPNADNVVEDEGEKAYKDGMELTVNEYGGYTVTDYDGKAASIAIPETYNGKTITKIGAWAFKDCTGITSVSVPSGVTVIDTGAFYGCSSLNKLTVAAANKVYRSEGNCIISIVTQELMIGCKGSVIPEKNVKSIANYAFYGCTGLENINIPQNITEIGVSSFEDCVSLTEITFPETLTEIKSSAFERCEALESITFTSKEKSKSAVIGSSAFEGCESLNSIVFNNAVEKIGIQAFYDCTSLVEVTVPDAVKEIGESAFGGCVSLENITVPFVGKNNYENYHNLGYIFKIRKNSDSSGSVPSSLKTVKVSNGKEKVTLFNDSFGNCSDINEIIIGEGVESIDYHAFYNCKSLQKITISGTDLTTIRGKAFEDCISLTSFELPACVTELEPTAFYRCDKLVTLTAAEGNEKYSSEENCIIETETKKIVAGCEGSVIPASVISIGESAFEGCNFAEITIPSNIVEIGNSAFSGCGNLEKVNLSKGLETIGGSAFSYAAITSIEIPASVTSIGYGAFSECNELASVTLNEGLETIGDYAFYSTAITSIEIPASVTSIGNDAFYECNELTSVTLNEGLETIGGYAFYSTAITSIEIPASVTSIGYGAFSECNELTSVTLNEGLETIGGSAFSYAAITSIEIPASVTSIGYNAFYGCNELTSVTLNEGLKTIGSYAFYSTAVTSIKIPSSVTSIGYDAFGNCETVENITVPFVGGGAENKYIGYIFGAESYEENASTIPEVLTSVTVLGGEIADNAFYGCGGITSVTLSENITAIGENAFKG